MLLNIGLVLAAMTLGFVYKKEDLTDRQGEHPVFASTSQKLQTLEREALGHARSARVSMGGAAAQAGRINHLLESHPLREWQGKQDRLQSVILQFRGENARLRGLDPASVIAFAQPSRIVFPRSNEDEELRRPTEFDQLLEELSQVEAEYARVAAFAIPTGVQSAQMDERIMKLLIAVAALALVVTGCDKAVGSESPDKGHSYIVGIDISGSRTKAELDESKQLLDALIERCRPAII